jgi:protease I
MAQKKALILTADGFEDMELFVPKYRLEEEGWAVEVAAPNGGRVYGEHGYEAEATHAFDQVDPADYDLLLVPGGPEGGGADTVRSYRAARTVVRQFFEQQKPVAAICHGPWVLVSSDVVEGRRMTSVRSDGVPEEIEEQGGTWEDAEVVVDGNLVTSRTPEDLPAFMAEVMRLAEKKRRRAPADRNGMAKGTEAKEEAPEQVEADAR